MADNSSNLPEYTVSEISVAVKRTLEGAFERVRVRGEISGFKRASSGHLYFALKDAEAKLDAVCWRTTAGRLAVAPEDGLEVIAIGRVSSYPGRSSYQLLVESLELAGEGALLKLLEERRKKLAAEGLFDAGAQAPLPFLPEVIGVITSPTGAVIRDILHRLADRFPRRVLVWPVLVQGERAKDQIAAAIAGFNAMLPGGRVPRPDLLIVARGGGSLEDLWAFNEEIVVRAAAASRIPLISAVGHETDTTLIDHAADRRAPTPTAAAEMAVPVRAELLADACRMARGWRARCAASRTRRGCASKGWPRPAAPRPAHRRAHRDPGRLRRAAAPCPHRLFQRRQDQVARLVATLPTRPADRNPPPAVCVHAGGAACSRDAGPAAREGAGPGPGAPRGAAAERHADPAAGQVRSPARLLGSLSYQQVLARGFALVRDGPAILWCAPRRSSRASPHHRIRRRQGGRDRRGRSAGASEAAGAGGWITGESEACGRQARCRAEGTRKLGRPSMSRKGSRDDEGIERPAARCRSRGAAGPGLAAGVGPAVIAVRQGKAIDISEKLPLSALLLNEAEPAKALAAAAAKGRDLGPIAAIIDNSEEEAGATRRSPSCWRRSISRPSRPAASPSRRACWSG